MKIFVKDACFVGMCSKVFHRGKFGVQGDTFQVEISNSQVAVFGDHAFDDLHGSNVKHASAGLLQHLLIGFANGGEEDIDKFCLSIQFFIECVIGDSEESTSGSVVSVSSRRADVGQAPP